MLKDIINQEDFYIATQRLCLVPLSDVYVNEYFEEFNPEITKYQYPDSFANIDATKDFFTSFIQFRREGTSLICIILDDRENFIGSVEAHNIHTKTPELGIWIAQRYQAMGYGAEAIKGMMKYIKANRQVDYFMYEADCRNYGSIKLIDKLNGEKQGHEEILTESGKELKLDMYYIK